MALVLKLSTSSRSCFTRHEIHQQRFEQGPYQCPSLGGRDRLLAAFNARIFRSNGFRRPRALSSLIHREAILLVFRAVVDEAPALAHPTLDGVLYGASIVHLVF